jgi:FkbM family methyltransferase
MVKALNRPYYVYRPRQLLRRVRFAIRPPSAPTAVALPWRFDITVDPHEDLGRTLLRNAVYELGVSELLYRLTDPDDLVLDVGANIGYMTSVFAAKLSPSGEIIACEPHPALFERLASHVRCWTDTAVRRIRPLPVAVSDRAGVARLAVPQGFSTNMGIAYLQDETRKGGVEVEITRLDDLVPAGTPVGVIKIDVEGHEHRVLSGGNRLLSTRQVRDIVFEDHGSYPTESTSLLENWGYRVFGIQQHLRGVAMVDPGAADHHPGGLPQNFVASSEPERLLSRMRRSGWQLFKADVRSSSGADH